MLGQLLINTAMFLFAAFGSLVVGALILNNPPMHAPPGFSQRLFTYLTTNVAETAHRHPFPELELRCYQMSPSALFMRIERALAMLDWDIMDSDARHYTLHAVVESRLLKFKDDVEIRLQATEGGTELHIRSSSRMGRGDLGANTRHILDLLTLLGRQI